MRVYCNRYTGDVTSCKEKEVRHETKSKGVITVQTHGKCNLFVLYIKS